MASKSGSLDMSDLKDAALLLQAFEEQNQCSITVTLRVAGVGEGARLVAEARALDYRSGATGRKLLALVSANSAKEKCRSLGGLLTFLLYQLDFELAGMEFDRAHEKRA